MKTVVYAAIFIFAALQIYVRLSPSAVTRWHVDPFSQKAPKRGGALVQFIVPLEPDDALARLDEVAQTEPRTKRLAGAPETERSTYVTRSALWGFPDYTTIAARPHADGAEVAIFARLRFGADDFDVNKKRVESWRAAAGL